MNEKRKLDMLFNIAMSLFTLLLLGNIVEILLDINSNFIKINILDSTNTCILAIVPAMLLIYFLIKYSKYNCTDEVERRAKRLARNNSYILIIDVVLILIFIICNVNKEIITSLLFMTFFSICMYYFRFRGYIELLNDRWYSFKKSIEFGKGYDVNSNSIWRFKIWLSPKVKLSDKDTNINIYKIMFTSNGGKIITIAFILSIFIGVFFSTLIVLAVVISAIYLERKLELYTCTKGIITGIEEGKIINTEEKKSSYYNVFVTDFDNKREIKVRVRTIAALENTQELTVYHGAITKTVLKIDGIPIKLLH